MVDLVGPSHPSAMKVGLFMWRISSNREWEQITRELVSVGAHAIPAPTLSRIEISAEGTREFSLFERSSKFDELRSVILTMQNRFDFSGTFRLIDRDLKFRDELLRVFSFLAEKRFDFACFSATPHGSVAFMFEAVFRWYRVPVLFFQPSLVGPQSLPRKSLVEPFRYALSPRIREKYSEELKAVVTLAEESISRLEAGKGTAKVAFQRERERSSRSIFGRVRAIKFFFSRLGKGLHYLSVNFSSHKDLPGWFVRPLEVFLDWSLRRSLSEAIRALPSDIPETRMKFALFALHYEPERCSIPEGYPFSSQIDAVIRARALLPEDVVLIVKEHFSQSASALRGTLGRSPDTYQMLESVPGVKVLGIGADTPGLVSRAECVFTLTGKVGIEATLKGIPVVYGGQPWWGEIPGSASLSSFDGMSELTCFLESSRPSRDEVFAWLSQQFADILVPVLGDATVDRYTKRISPLPERFGELQLAVLAEIVRCFLDSEFPE